MESVVELIRSFGFFGWILIIVVVAIVVAVPTNGLVAVYRMRIKHAERMALIEQGEDPGDVEQAYLKDKV